MSAGPVRVQLDIPVPLLSDVFKAIEDALVPYNLRTVFVADDAGSAVPRLVVAPQLPAELGVRGAA